MKERGQYKERGHTRWTFTLNARSGNVCRLTQQFFCCPMLKYDDALYETLGPIPEAIDVNTAFTPDPALGIRTLFVQIERGVKSQLLHLQGYFECRKPITVTLLTKSTMAGLEWSSVFGKGQDTHYNIAFASRQQNRGYCSKTNTQLGGRLPGTSCIAWGEIDGEPGDVITAVDSRSSVGEVQVSNGQIANITITKCKFTSAPTAEQVEEREHKRKLSRMDQAKRKRDGVQALIDRAIREKASVFDCIQWAKELWDQASEEVEEQTLAQLVYNQFMSKYKLYDEFIEKRIHKQREDDYKAGNITFRKVQTIVYYGPPGTGKTYLASTGYHHLGIPYLKNLEDRFWSGYKGNAVVVLEEFVGHGPYSKLQICTPAFILRVLDCSTLLLDPKCEKQVPAEYTLVIITTNLKFEEWFDGWQGIPLTTKKAIFDRIGEEGFIEIKGESRRQERAQEIPQPRNVVARFESRHEEPRPDSNGGTGHR